MPSRYPRVQKTFGIVFVAAGVAALVGGIAYERYLTKNRPNKSTPTTGEVVSIDKGNPHHFVTNEEYLLLGMPFGIGPLLIVVGVRLIEETK